MLLSILSTILHFISDLLCLASVRLSYAGRRVSSATPMSINISDGSPFRVKKGRQNLTNLALVNLSSKYTLNQQGEA